MAAPGTSTTSTSGLQTEVATYFDELLISTLDPATRFLQFGQRRPLPPNRGNIVNWNRAFRLGLGYSLTEGTPISAAKQLSSTNVSATIMQFGDVLNISDYVQLVGTFNARKVATERLAVQAAECLNLSGHFKSFLNILETRLDNFIAVIYNTVIWLIKGQSEASTLSLI